MLLWSLIIDKVHRNRSTGIDWDSPPRPLTQSLDVSLTKIAGLWATWAAIASAYCLARWYWDGTYLFAPVPAGTYRLRAVNPNGYTPTTSDNVAITVPADGTITTNFGTRAVPTGEPLDEQLYHVYLPVLK